MLVTRDFGSTTLTQTRAAPGQSALNALRRVGQGRHELRRPVRRVNQRRRGQKERRLGLALLRQRHRPRRRRRRHHPPRGRPRVVGLPVLEGLHRRARRDRGLAGAVRARPRRQAAAGARAGPGVRRAAGRRARAGGRAASATARRRSTSAWRRSTRCRRCSPTGSAGRSPSRLAGGGIEIYRGQPGWSAVPDAHAVIVARSPTASPGARSRCSSPATAGRRPARPRTRSPRIRPQSPTRTRSRSTRTAPCWRRRGAGEAARRHAGLRGAAGRRRHHSTTRSCWARSPPARLPAAGRPRLEACVPGVRRYVRAARVPDQPVRLGAGPDPDLARAAHPAARHRDHRRRSWRSAPARRCASSHRRWRSPRSCGSPTAIWCCTASSRVAPRSAMIVALWRHALLPTLERDAAGIALAARARGVDAVRPASGRRPGLAAGLALPRALARPGRGDGGTRLRRAAAHARARAARRRSRAGR